MTTSSTSASSASRGWRRLPWAGLLAVALVLGVDRAVFDSGLLWPHLAVDDPESAAETRLELSQLARDTSGRPRVAVVGTSRVIDGFDKPLAEKLMPGAVFAKMGYPRFEPFAILSLVPDLVDAGVDAVCLVASEQDTHRPLRLEPVPGSSAASLGAVLDLLSVTDLSFAVNNRTALYRLVATSLLETYRFRPDLLLAGLDAWRQFPRPERLRQGPSKKKADPFRPVALWGAPRHQVPPERKRSTMDLFPPGMDSFKARIEAGTVQEITEGPHVAVQEALFRQAVEELRAAGIQVVIVQGVMHPAADDLYDTRQREEFLRYMEELARDPGVHFIPRSAMPRFAESDFYDLVHTNARGRVKVTRAMLRGLRATPIAR